MEKKASFSVLLICIGWFFTFCSAERIVFLTPVGSKSHKFAFMPIAEELALRGHKVTVVSAFKATKSIKNIHEIHLKDTEKLIEEVQIDWFEMSNQSPMVQSTTMLSHIRKLITEGYDNFIQHPEVKEIFEKRAVDLFVVDAIFTDFVYPPIDKLKVPIVLHSSGPGLPWTLGLMGAAMDYAFVPSLMTTFSNQMTFTERLINVVSTEIFKPIRQLFLIDLLDGHIKKTIQDARLITEIERDIALCIVNSHPTTGLNV